jgi:hypothetical protein
MKPKEETKTTEELVLVKLFHPQKAATEVLILGLVKKMMFLLSTALLQVMIVVKMIVSATLGTIMKT